VRIRTEVPISKRTITAVFHLNYRSSRCRPNRVARCQAVAAQPDTEPKIPCHLCKPWSNQSTVGVGSLPYQIPALCLHWQGEPSPSSSPCGKSGGQPSTCGHANRQGRPVPERHAPHAGVAVVWHDRPDLTPSPIEIRSTPCHLHRDDTVPNYIRQNAPNLTAGAASPVLGRQGTGKSQTRP
jgi:hypothetical protein